MMNTRYFLWIKNNWQMAFVLFAGIMIIIHFVLQSLSLSGSVSKSLEKTPLILTLLIGAIPLLKPILVKISKGDFGADILAAITILTAVILDQYLAATLIIIMLASGKALETYAMGKASSILKALADRMPTHGYIKDGENLRKVDLHDIKIGDYVAVFPHTICPVDGAVIEGHGTMNEAYLTGEPYDVPKALGSMVISGAVNGDSLLIIKAEKPPADSRYSKIVEVMKESQQKRPQLRRLGDQLGALYMPIAFACAGMAWIVTGEPIRFLSVLVIATPCPLLLAIPITIISAISMAARNGIIIKDPVSLERLPTCKTAIFDKTGTLTYGKPTLVHIYTAQQFDENFVLQIAASLERYSKHPLAHALINAGKKAKLLFQQATNVSEKAGQGLHGIIEGKKIHITDRKHLLQTSPESIKLLPPISPGLECILTIDNDYAATFLFRDVPRKEGSTFISHIRSIHKFKHIILMSGDKESEVKYLADVLGIHEVFASQSPEQKLENVHKAVAKAPTVFVGDGINDAPAISMATVGIAFGKESSITAEAAGVVIMDSNLNKVDELIHISYAMRKIALQSAVGGILLSIIGMGLAAAGFITPVLGALIQEGIDVLAILNALRLTFAHNTQLQI
jgi:heavy metal translocating P-type ATPase